MTGQVSHASILVEDQAEALQFYTEKLGFETKQDMEMANFRWLVVGPPDQEFGFVLIPADTEREEERVGNQSGDRYAAFTLTVDDCVETYEALKERGVEFLREPQENPWGIATQFTDLYGNMFELVEKKRDPSSEG